MAYRVTAALAMVAGLAGPRLARADDAYLMDHPDAAWWLSAQLNVISQAQPGFHAPYSGDNSFRPDDHAATSLVATVYAGYELTPTTAIVVAGESARGGGLSAALGIAGFSNLDVVRNPTLGAAPYLGRAFIDQIIPLSDVRQRRDRDPLHLLRALPERRIEDGPLQRRDRRVRARRGRRPRHHGLAHRGPHQVRRRAQRRARADRAAPRLRPARLERRPRRVIRLHRGRQHRRARRRSARRALAPCRRQARRRRGLERPVRRPPPLPRARRQGLPARRRPPELRPRDHRRGLLHAVVHRGLFAATDLQVIARPGYNRDRGPVAIGSLRLHVEL